MPYLVLLIVMFFAQDARATDFNPIERYGEKIAFDVVREGKIVGEHVTQFHQTGDEIVVRSDMNIDIFFAFIPLYALKYHTTETWQFSQLMSLDVNVLDGADRLKFTMKRRDGVMSVQLKDRAYDIQGDVLTTNHWNIDVVKDTQVLNTLTGNLNSVRVTPMGLEQVEVLGGSLQAERYDYSGDLKDTSVWYDGKGRWVKLRFLARDGSIIDYVCRTCIGDKNG